MPRRILIVDDEPSIIQLLKFNLEKSGYQVLTADNGREAYRLIVEEDFDFIVLDIMLPGIDGVEIVRKARQQNVQTPIIMLTAKDDEYDKIVSLELGADDYMTKPFSPRELVARIKALWRRSEMEGANQTAKADKKDSAEVEAEEIIRVGDLVIYVDRFEVYLQDQLIDLTPKELELLVYFAKRPNRILSRERLLESVWDYDFVEESRIVDVHVSHLREKIEENPRSPEYIVTVRGFGYRFEEPKK